MSAGRQALPAAVLGLFFVVLASGPVAAGEIAGIVTDAEDGSPLHGTHVEALDPGGTLVARDDTDPAGRFSLTGLAAGSYTLVLVRLGYETLRLEGIAVGDAGTVPLEITLAPSPILMDEIVVTASRRPERRLRAPASTSTLDRSVIASRPHLTAVDVAREVAGVDFASKGLMQHTFSVRGYRGAMSSTMLVLTDQRYAALPVLGFNLPYLIPAADEDIARIEIVRGPGAALYGPNSDHGVMHVITRSPFEHPGTTVSLAGGGRSVRQGTLRHAAVLGHDLALKLSAQILRGDDWEYRDPVEVENRRTALVDGADPDDLLIGRRDFGLERTAGEARLDWWPGEETSLVLTGGMAQTTNIDQANTVGAVQARDWRNSFLQCRLQHARLEGNLFVNATDAGETFALRTGSPIVDRSRILVGQLRHSTVLSGGHELLYGLDVRRSDPRTGGTLHGSNEDRDVTSEFGGYLSATAHASAVWDLVGALRVDYHDRINDVAVSPRLGAVYAPDAGQALRLTWNRAFSSPTANDLFMDYPAGAIMPGMEIRLRGTPQEGLRFVRDAGGCRMRSPLAPLGAEQLLPADATQVWDGYLQVLTAYLQDEAPDLAPLPEDLPAPDASEVASVAGVLDPRSLTYRPVSLANLADVEADRRVITETLELGYKGSFGGVLSLAVDLYRTHVTDYFGELYAVTPSILFDEADLRDYLVTTGGLEPAAAAEVAAAAARIPAGTVAVEGFASADVLLANRQGGAYTIWGTDLALDWSLGRGLALAATYSWISNNTVTDQPDVGEMVLSVPRNKGSLSLLWREDRRGIDGAARLRVVGSFPVVSGLFQGEVGSQTVLDLDLGLRLSSAPDVHLSMSALNALDEPHREFVGAPVLGRLLLSRVRVVF